MTYRPRRRCRRCDRDRDTCGGVSRTGLCRDCGPLVLAEALTDLRSHSGPHYDAWLEGLTDAVARLWGARLPPEGGIGQAADNLPMEVQEWLDGHSPQAVTPPTRPTTRG